MKKKLTQTLAFLLIASSLSPSTIFAASIFNDVPETHWAYSSILKMKQYGYMVPTSNGDFLPSKQVTYFDLAEILAKVTGYQDELVNKNMDESLKNSIKSNYEKQEPTLKKMENTYTSWSKLANEEIAYLLGRGYITVEDLNLFVSNVNGKEVHTVLQKQDLARFLVRILQKEKSALSDWELSKSTGFSDEKNILDKNKPYVAYLKKSGVINGSGTSFGANDSVTRAILSKMIADTLNFKTSLDASANNSTSNSTTNNTTNTGLMSGEITKIIPKNETDTYVLIKNTEGKTSFFTANNESIVKKGTTVVDINSLKVGDTINYKTINKNQTELLSEIQITNTTTSNNVSDTTTNSDTTVSETTKVEGIFEKVGSNNTITIRTSDSKKTYLLNPDYKVFLNNKESDIDKLETEDEVQLVIKNNYVLEINATIIDDESTSKEDILEVEISNLLIKEDKTLLEVKEKNKTYTLQLDNKIELIKKDSVLKPLDLRVGDIIVVSVNKNDEISSLEVLSETSSASGTIKEINLSQNPYIILTDKSGQDLTYYISLDTELYDQKNRKDMSLKDLSIGMNVEIFAESKHAISITRLKESKSIIYKGVIQNVGARTQYIDVLIDYDQVTGESLILKRMFISESEIEKNGKTVHKTELEENLNVLITLNSIFDKSPSKVMIIN